MAIVEIITILLFSLSLRCAAWASSRSSLGTWGLRTRGLRTWGVSASTQATYEHSVYIEDTDAMGIMLNSEYPRQMERALNVTGGRVFGFQTLKYRTPVELGDHLRWSTASGSKAGTFKVMCEREADEEIVCTASGVRAAPVLEEGCKIHDSSYSSAFVVHEDEFCPSSRLLHTRTIFNFFERARTNVLGGGKHLKALMNDASVVVARVSNYSLLPHAVHSKEELIVHTQLDNMGVMSDFFQTICTKDGTPLAQATVTCLALSQGGTPMPLEL
jgi:acyl-CoA thioesterase FadM